MTLHFDGNLVQLILLAFLAIVFLQSGMDKIMDWKGNRSWLIGHFAQSPFKNGVPLLLGIITILELAGGTLSLLGSVDLLLYGNTALAFYGALLSAITLLLLLLGQRVAKDYEGAKTIVIYLVPTVFLLFLLQ